MTTDGSCKLAKQEIRKMLLAQRQALPGSRRRVLDGLLCAQLLEFLSERDGQRISAYWPFRGEPDLRPALIVLHQAGREIHLPVVAGAEMEFRRWTPEDDLVSNYYGIPEPVDGCRCSPEALDWVLMPLLAFSRSGMRLGMGGGYYDRTFAFCLRSGNNARPGLVGAAYALQEIDSLPTQSWDVPLDAVITDGGLHEFRSLPGRPPSS